MALLIRGLTPLLGQLLDASKVVVLEGGRGVGKTTLARQIGAERGFQTYFDLADPADRIALGGDPHRVLAAAPKPILVDEAQLEPELPVAVKRLVDASSDMGQVLLTGSARIGRGALGGSDPLVGRAMRLRLSSFTHSELRGGPNQSLASWWEDERLPLAVHPELGLTELFDLFTTGGLPAVALHESSPAPIADDRTRVFDAYVEGVLTLNLAGTRTNRSRLVQTFRYLAANPGQILNVSRAASELGMRVETLRNYLDLCDASFLLDVVPAHRPSQHQTLVAHPRVFASDVGLAAWAADASADKLLRDSKLAGSLLENLVAQELTAQAAWSRTSTRVFHWRDSRAGREVDLVLRRSTGEMVAIEVKSASQVSMADAKGILAFDVAAKAKMARGVIVYTGRTVQQLADNIWAVPLQSLLAPA